MNDMGMRDIKTIAIHCTASADSIDIGVKEINEWHKTRGWMSPSGVSCGYHYIIRRNGTIEVGRPESESGAHVAGHNSTSIGISWVGINEISERQQKALLSKVRELLVKYNLTLDAVKGHCEFPGVTKTCPNLDMDHFRAELIFAGDKDEKNTRIPEQEPSGVSEDESSTDFSDFLHNLIKHWFGPR